MCSGRFLSRMPVQIALRLMNNVTQSRNNSPSPPSAITPPPCASLRITPRRCNTKTVLHKRTKLSQTAEPRGRSEPSCVKRVSSRLTRGVCRTKFTTKVCVRVHFPVLPIPSVVQVCVCVHTRVMQCRDQEETVSVPPNLP